MNRMILAVVLTQITLPARAQDAAAKKPTFADNVAPIFAAKCNACHNNDKKKGGLVLDAYTSLMQGGASGAVVEPGDPDNSRLYLLVAHEEEPAMPPSAPKIPDADIDVIRKWIEAGAPETSGSAVAVKAKPKMEFKLDPAAIGKPTGEPAMPTGLTTQPVVTSSRPPAVRGLAHSPWAPLAAVAGHKQVLLYNTQSRRLLGVLPFPEGNVEVLRFTRDGDLLLAGGGRGGQSGRVVVWNVKTGDRLFEIGKEYDTVLAADISPDRSLIALGGPSKMLRVYSTADGELLYECKKHTDWVTAAAFSPDGVLLASGDRNGGLLVWEAPNGREFHDLRAHSAMISDIAWRLDSNLLASASEDTNIRLWEMQNGGNIKGWAAHGGGVESVQFAKDGRLVSTGRDRVAKLWNADGGQIRQFDAFPDITLRAVFSHDDLSILASDFSGEVRQFELTEGKLLGTLAANPAPVAVRLEQARQRQAEATAAVATATAELPALQTRTEAATQAITTAQQALDAAARAYADASTARKTADQAQEQHTQAIQAATTTLSATTEAADRALKLRDAALADLHTRSVALDAATNALAQTNADRERQLADQATADLDAATQRLAAALPEWNAAIEAVGLSRLAFDRTASAQAATAVERPARRLAESRAQAGVTAAQAALVAASQARQEADQAQAALAARIQSLQAAATEIQQEVDALTTEQAALDANAAQAQASAASVNAPAAH